MNIKEELKVLDSSNDFGDEIIKQVMNQQEELEKKIHILKMVSFADKMEEIVATDLFIKHDIEILQLNCEHDDENGFGYKAEFHLVDKNGEIVAGYYDAEDHEQALILHKMFDDLDGFNFDLANTKFKYGTTGLELKPGIKEGLLSLFLDTELKKIYDYNKMDIELPNENGNSNKKIKM